MQSSHRSRHIRHAMVAALFLSTSGCGKDEPSPPVAVALSLAATNGITLGSQQAGPTPFLAFIDLKLERLDEVTEVSYFIEPKAGSASKPVHVTYTMDALRNRGRVSASAITLPIIGLYAGYTNTASVEVRFRDGSFNRVSPNIVTQQYTADTPFQRPTVNLQRKLGSSLGYSYFMTKPNDELPATILDSDGNIRWVSTTAAAASVLFRNNGIDIGAAESPALRREELDGRVSMVSLPDPTVYRFHHNFEPGPKGILAELDVNGRVEDLVAEIAPDGSRIKTWDLVQIISDYMRSQNDDPTNFVRPGADWFHVNSSIYDAADDSIIVSSRENFVMKLDYSTGAIKWILGDPQKHWFTFASLRAKALSVLGGGLYPIGQHALSFTPQGELMMFDNGYESLNMPAGALSGGSRDYSAVRAYRIDGTAMAATPTVTFDDTRSVLSQICSSAYLSNDGSMLINYSHAKNGTELRIKGLDPQRQPVFDISYPTEFTCTSSWNAIIVPFEDIRFTI